MSAARDARSRSDSDEGSRGASALVITHIFLPPVSEFLILGTSTSADASLAKSSASPASRHACAPENLPIAPCSLSRCDYSILLWAGRISFPTARASPARNWPPLQFPRAGFGLTSSCSTIAPPPPPAPQSMLPTDNLAPVGSLPHPLRF